MNDIDAAIAQQQRTIRMTAMRRPIRPDGTPMELRVPEDLAVIALIAQMLAELRARKRSPIVVPRA